MSTGCQGIDLRFERVYLSQSLLSDTPFGYGWTHNYNQEVITLTQDYVAVRRPRGEHLIFKDVGTDVYASFSFEYLLTGQISTTQIAGLHPITFTYGSNGLPTTVHQGLRTWQYSYDATGNLVGITDPLSRTVNVGYDLATRPISQTLTDGRSIDFGYDSLGNMTSLTPPGRDDHTFTPTALNLLDVYTPPPVEGATQPISYTYNAAGQVTQIQRPDTSTIDLLYDAAGRLATSTIPRGAYDLDYDANTGVLSHIVAPGGITLTYAYTGLLPTGQSWQGPVNGSVDVGYDLDLRLTSEAVNGQAVSFGYDAAGRLNQAGDLTLSHNPQNGLLTGMSLLNVADAWQYNDFGEPSSYQANHSGTNVLSTSYDRDELGRIITKTESVSGTIISTGYTYDAAGRLSAVVEDGVTVAQYSYDLNGNRLAYTDTVGTVITATYDAQDRLVQYGSNLYEYTAAGELQTKIDASANLTTTYSYDAFGNLTSATLPDGTQLAYLIDGQNRRIGKQVDGVLTQGFLYKDQLNPVAELDGSGQVTARFIYGSKAHVPDYMVKNETTYRILTDHLGSPRLVVNATTGQIVQELAYDAFGNVLIDTNPGFQPFGFAGGLYDQHTKLTRFGARDYDAENGRWTAKDPLGFGAGDTNLYTYVFNDPVNFIDPDGNLAILAAMAIGFVAGFIIDIAIQALFHECGWENFTINDVDFKQAAISGFIGAAGAGVSGIVSSLTSSTTSLFTRTGLRIVGNGLGSALVTGTAKYYEMLNNGIWGGSDIGDDWSEVAYSSAISGLLGMFGSAIGEGIVIVNGGVKALPEILANRYGGISPRFENLISPTIVSMADSFSWFISSGSSGLFVEETSQCSCE